MVERRKLLTIAIVGCSLLPMKISGEQSVTTLTQDVFVLRKTLWYVRSLAQLLDISDALRMKNANNGLIRLYCYWKLSRDAFRSWRLLNRFCSILALLTFGEELIPAILGSSSQKPKIEKMRKWNDEKRMSPTRGARCEMQSPSTTESHLSRHIPDPTLCGIYH